MYMKFPGHKRLLSAGMVEGNEKATERVALVAAGFRWKKRLHAGTT
jgi:hypothetical protein